MCDSRYHRVVAPPDGATVRVEDSNANEHDVSLLAYEGPAPQINDWLVVHSGYALAKANPAEAESAVAAIRSVRKSLTE